MFVMNWEQPNLEIQEIINNFKIRYCLWENQCL